jgi:hypothetical protein
MKELQVVLKRTLLAILIAPIGTPLSGSASNNTCIQIDLDIMNPSIDKQIGHLIVVVPLRKELRNILCSTWVVWYYG